MKRAFFSSSAIAYALAAPALATGRKKPMALDAFQAELHDSHLRTKSLEVRHIGAYVSLRVAISPAQLAAQKPIATTSDAHIISAFFDAVRAAQPTPTMDGSEQRWSVTCLDGAGKSILVVTTSIFAPRDGTIGAHRVIFADDLLVEFLAKHFAPDEVGASARR